MRSLPLAVYRLAVTGAVLLLTAQPAALHAQRSAGPVPTSVRSAGPPGLRRVPADSVWRRVWIVGGDSTVDTFVEPRQLVLSGDLAVVLDMGTREIHALDRRTGVARFVIKPRGMGPGEFRKPALLASTPGGFGVVDHATARFTAFDRTGRWLWMATLTDVFITSGLCVRDGNRIVTTLTRRDSSIVEFDSTGRRLTVRSVPWTQLVRGAVGFAYDHVTSSASRAGSCVVAPLFGAEWAVIPPASPPRAFALLEPGAQPVVVETRRVLDRSLTSATIQRNQQSETPQVSRGVMIVGDTAIINAAHTRTEPLRWLDYYLVTSGQYLFSRRLPFPVNAISAGDDGTLYVTTIGQTASVVMAIKPATLTEAVKGKR